MGYLYFMKANTASRTAQYMALYRAMESGRANRKRLFTDPYAILFLDKGYRLACRLSSFPPAERFFYYLLQRRIPGSLASGLARTRYIDDLLEKTIREGTRQVIIPGAGFDTRSLRLDYLKGVPVIEIDHPDTARRKLAALKMAENPDGNTRYLQADLDKQDLRTLFREKGIDLSLRTTLIWEGVTNYLQRGAVDKTFSLMRQFPEGSSIIFTYIDQKVLDEPGAFFGAGRLLKDLEALEEKWTCGFYPREMPSYLGSFGIRLLEDKGAAEYRERYLPERKSILKGYEFYRVAIGVLNGE